MNTWKTRATKAETELIQPGRDPPAGPSRRKATKTLSVLNDPAYGTERSYNGLRLAHALAKRDGEHVRVFLMADATGCALAGQQTPNGYYNLERLLSSVIRRGAAVGLCGTCMDARAIDEGGLVEGARRSSLDELTDWTIWADKVITC